MDKVELYAMDSDYFGMGVTVPIAIRLGTVRNGQHEGKLNFAGRKMMIYTCPFTGNRGSMTG